MKKIALGALAVFVLSFTLPLVAQDDGASPAPNVIQIYREMVKPGRTAAHEKVEMGWPRAFRASKNPSHYLAMTSITGPTEAWFVAGYPSYEAWEKESKAQAEDATLTAETNRLSAVDGELLENVRSITAHYRDDMSHRPADQHRRLSLHKRCHRSRSSRKCGQIRGNPQNHQSRTRKGWNERLLQRLRSAVRHAGIFVPDLHSNEVFERSR